MKIKMKKRKGETCHEEKVLAVLLAVSMLAGTGLAVPGNLMVQAEENVVESIGDNLQYENYTYQLSEDEEENGVKITGHKEDENIKEISVPSEIDGMKVTAIGMSAFKDCSDLISVTIPASVKTDCIKKMGKL